MFRFLYRTQHISWHRSEQFSLRLMRISATICLFCCLVPLHNALAMTVENEIAIDQMLGVLSRSWRINYIRMINRDYLRSHARVTTGFPAYDQQVEHAGRMPKELHNRLQNPSSTICSPQTMTSGDHSVIPVQPPVSAPPSAPASSTPASVPASSTPIEIGLTLPMAPTASTPPTANAVSPGSQNAWEPQPRPVYFADPTR